MSNRHGDPGNMGRLDPIQRLIINSQRNIEQEAINQTIADFMEPALVAVTDLVNVVMFLTKTSPEEAADDVCNQLRAHLQRSIEAGIHPRYAIAYGHRLKELQTPD